MEGRRLGLEFVRFLNVHAPSVPAHQSKLMPLCSTTSVVSATSGPFVTQPWGSREICNNCLVMASVIRCQQSLFVIRVSTGLHPQARML